MGDIFEASVLFAKSFTRARLLEDIMSLIFDSTELRVSELEMLELDLDLDLDTLIPVGRMNIPSTFAA